MRTENSLWNEFTQSYLGKLDLIVLGIKGRIQGGFAGARKSKAKGASVEFSDFRNYAPGDDIRRIDWNSYGRLDKLFIKMYEEEKQATINIFLDKSLSMDFGEPNKFRYGKVFAASAAYVALAGSDKVNLFTINDSVSFDQRGISAKALFAGIIEFLDQLEAAGETDLDKALGALPSARGGANLSLVISDFMSPAGYEKALQRLLYMKQQVCAVHILSPQELSPEYVGFARLVDMENGRHIDIEADDVLMKNYDAELKKYLQGLQRYCKSKSVNYIMADTAVPVLKWIGGAMSGG